MDNGWISLHRKFKEKGYYNNSKYVHLWIHILLSANHAPKEFLWNGKTIVVKEGQFITGRDKISKATGIHRSSVDRILNFFENEHQIEQQKTTKYRLIKILNWKDYQNLSNKTSNKRATNEQQVSTNNKYNNNNKDTAEPSSADTSIPELIKEFETINPASKKFYGNKTQREACQFLIDTYTFERVKTVIQKTLLKTNGLQYFPTITTPVQLRDKWATLESAIIKYRSESNNKGKGIA